MVSHLSNAANSILIPRLPIYSRRPVVTLPTLSPSDTVESFPHMDDTPLTGGAHEKHHGLHVPRPRRKHKTQDQLDSHVEHVLKRRAKLRRALKGLRDFLLTRTSLSNLYEDASDWIVFGSLAVGVIAGIYGFLVGQSRYSVAIYGQVT